MKYLKTRDRLDVPCWKPKKKSLITPRVRTYHQTYAFAGHHTHTLLEVTPVDDNAFSIIRSFFNCKLLKLLLIVFWPNLNDVGKRSRNDSRAAKVEFVSPVFYGCSPNNLSFVGVIYLETGDERRKAFATFSK
jgi:hypothetical protein